MTSGHIISKIEVKEIWLLAIQEDEKVYGF
jgi:hypothetical protein